MDFASTTNAYFRVADVIHRAPPKKAAVRTCCLSSVLLTSLRDAPSRVIHLIHLIHPSLSIMPTGQRKRASVKRP